MVEAAQVHDRLNDHFKLSLQAAQDVLPIIQDALAKLAARFAAKPPFMAVKPLLRASIHEDWSALGDAAVLVEVRPWIKEDTGYALWLDTGSDMAAEEGDFESSLDYWNVDIEQAPVGHGKVDNLLRTVSRDAAIGAFINHIALDIVGHVVGEVLSNDKATK